ncbi:hypothetical protein SAMN05444360_12252 [Chryseobacterium carnipullorum]|nr:hypothetical protein SAMN05444360_12252 [Chryseobacterium carnipullorum]
MQHTLFWKGEGRSKLTNRISLTQRLTIIMHRVGGKEEINP